MRKILFPTCRKGRFFSSKHKRSLTGQTTGNQTLQVQELLERAKEQERTIAKYRDEVSRLQGELEVSASKKTEVQSPVNLNKLLEVVERIDSMKKIPTFNDTVYEIDRNSFDLWIKRFKDELKQ
jgi:predicted RNase H-like nuclease (RuvC/YqgF family)